MGAQPLTPVSNHTNVKVRCHYPVLIQTASNNSIRPLFLHVFTWHNIKENLSCQLLGGSIIYWRQRIKSNAG